METKDPALTKTPIGSHETIANIITDTTADHNVHDDHHIDGKKGTQTFQETVVGSNLINDIESLDDDTIHHSNEHTGHSHNINQQTGFAHAHDELESETSVTNNTDTFKDEVLDTEHVNEGDNPARQPDRRDQQGSTAFDEGINEDTVGSEAPKSEDINDMNRYASVDNAQSRILNPDEKD